MPGELVLQTLGHVWHTLSEMKVPMAVMGGIAATVWNYLRATKDVDILVLLEDKDLSDAMARLAKAGIRRKSTGIIQLGDIRIVQAVYEPPDSFIEIQIDLVLADTEFQRQALQRTQPAILPGTDVAVEVLSCEDLILFKLNAGRILDLADCAYLLRFNRARLDFPYLNRWRDHFGLQKEFAQVWEEAFPGERPPMSGDAV